jgi:hypothetical protein
MAENVPVSGNDLNLSGMTPDKKYGVWGDAGGGQTNDEAGYGVVGTSFQGPGVAGIAADRAVYGRAIGEGQGDPPRHGGIGVFGENNTPGGIGISAQADGSGGIGLEVHADGDVGIGVDVHATGASGTGIKTAYDGQHEFGWALIATNQLGNTTAELAGTNTAGHFVGNLGIDKGDVFAHGSVYIENDASIAGNLTKAGGGCRIDHPLDPANRYFAHAFVESAEMKNVYDGVVMLDAKGEATVKLPRWFEAVNENFRYQLTSIGAPAPNLHLASKISKGRFNISGGRPKTEVSWQVTGVRKDPWAQKHRIVVEEEKPADEKGLYLHPSLYGKPNSKRLCREFSSEASAVGKKPKLGRYSRTAESPRNPRESHANSG